MLYIYFYTLLSVTIVSLLSFVGIFTLAIKLEKLKKLTMSMVSLSAGTLLGGAVLHLMPEAIERDESNQSIWLLFLCGILIFFILEKIICWRHCHIPTTKFHPHPLGMMNLIGDGFHNFIDGMIIAGAFLVDVKLGAATTIAIISHEIPQEIGDFGVLIHAGYSRTRALFLNFLIATTAIMGAIVALIIGGQIENFSSFIIPLTAGGFIYIATADLIPELKKNTELIKSINQLAIILIGIGIMFFLK